MKTVYITEGQIKAVENAVIKEDGVRRTLLNEENSTDRKKVERIISEFCVDMIKPYLLRPVEECDLLTANNDVESTTTYQSVKNNQHGFNRLIDYLRLNLYEQFGMTRDNGPARFRIGIARIACDDLGFYSFGQNLQGGKIIKFAKLMKLFAYKPDIMFEGGEEPDKNLNGMSYDEIMQEYGSKMERYIHQQKADIDSDAINDPNSILEPTRSTEDRDTSTPPEVYRCGDYKIYHINDTISNYQVSPTYACRNFLNWLGNYTQWCICGEMGAYEYAQYMGNGGNLYIMLKDGFQNIQREQGENCPLDEYGLSMIAVIVGTDGLPDNVTTRWNHDFGGENHSDMWEARQLQKLTGVKYSSIFKPRSQEQLRQMYLSEETEKPSAMDQVHNKVNAGVMDAVTCGGMMEEGQGNTETWYRGYNSKYGSDRTHLLWLTDDISYARAYGNRVEEILVDMDKLNAASIYEMDGICGYEIDYYEGIDKEDAEKAMQEGVGGYEFEVAENEGYYCLCLWDKSAIISRRELPKEEFDKIEPIDGYDNPAYDTEMKEMFCEGLINENSNDRKVNKYIKEKFGLTDFQDIRNKVMEIYEKIPYARVEGGRYMLGVLRLLFEENLPKDEYSVLNKILYKIANSNYYERQGVNDPNLGGKTFEELKEKYFVPDFEGTEFSTSEKIVRLKDGFTVTRIDSYDEMNARCDGEWCISYDDSLWYELVADGTVYLVENEELINKHDEAMDDKEYANRFEELCYIAGEEDDMDEMGLINSDLAWTNKPGSWKFPYDYYGLSRFVVIVYKNSFTVYSRYNMPNEFDGDYLTKGQLEKLLGIKFEDVFKFVPGNDGAWEYDEFGRKVPFGTVHHEWATNLNATNETAMKMAEGAEPEADEYKIGGEGGNNEYFHAMNESKIGNFDFKKYFKPIAEFMREDGLNVYPYPKIKLNWEPQDGLFIKTGYYEPETKTIVIFCDDRHPKDILRTFCHEMIHHSQNLDGVDLSFSSDDDVKDNERLEEIESEAYLKGNVYFRKWTEYAKKDSKDVLQEGRKKVVKNDEGEIVPEKCDKCGGDVVCQIHGEPVYVCKECGKYFGTVPFNLDESIDIHKALAALRKRRDPAGIEDWNSINEDTDPEDIDLSSFNIKTALNPKFWKDGHLDSRIRMKLLDIADDFIEFLGVDWVKPDDIIMTGSLANYNWNKKFSDIDLHILMDYSKVDKRKDFVDNYFYSQKKLWNDEHQDLKIFGFPVELYVQDTKEKHASTGVYSLDKDKWLKEPEREKLSTAKINKGLIKKKVAEYIDKIEDLLTIYKTADDDYKVRKVSEKADSLFDEIKKERRDSLGKKDTEITNGNIIFKCLRRLGYIEKLVNLKSETYDKMNSLS